MIREVGDNKYKFLNLYMKTESTKNPVLSKNVVSSDDRNS